MAATMRIRGAVAVLACASAWGCATPIHVPPVQPQDIARMEAMANFPHRLYRLEPGDTLEIEYPYHPEMKQLQVVRPDGKVDARLAGELVVAGLTTEELRRRLVEATSAQLREPEVVVRIAKFGEKTVYVGGEVNKPGLVAYARGLTPLQAVIAAGGFRDTARLDSVVLVRADRTRQDVMTRRLDMNAVLNSGAQEPLELAPSDLVYVPATGVAQANVWVRQHITDMLPFLRTSLPLLP